MNKRIRVLALVATLAMLAAAVLVGRVRRQPVTRSRRISR